MSDEANPEARRQHLARIQRLWQELQAAKDERQKYKILEAQIRQEAEAYRRAFGDDWES